MGLMEETLIAIFSPTEPEPEPAHAPAQVLRPVLHPVRRHQHSTGGDEQRAASLRQDALQVRPEGIHLQEASLQEREGEGLPHLQRSGLPGYARRGRVLRRGDLQQPDEDPAERLSGR